MAETYIVRINDIRSRKIRRYVRDFVEDEDVAVVASDGQILDVVLEKNHLVMKSSESW